MQISIPSFIIGSPTVYKVIVSTDNGPIELDKRFSDFVKLAADFQQEMDEPVPVLPPAKKWFGNSSAELCEQRRQDLELMLRALIRNPEFAQALCVSSFLELSRAKANRGMDWLQVSSKISNYISQAKSNSQATQKRKYCLEAKTLASQLQRSIDQSSVGKGERARRVAQLDEYLKTISQIESQVVAMTTSLNAVEDAGTRARQPSSGRVLGESDVTRQFNNAGLVQHQLQSIDEQDRRLEELRMAISRQKQLGLDIDSELTKQNEMLEELDAGVHHVNSKINQASRKTNRLL